MKAGELFAGYGGLALSVSEVFGATTEWVAEFDPDASKVLEQRFPGIPNLGDVTTVNWDQVEPVDIIAGGSPCFPAGTLIDTEQDGYLPIEDVQIGYRVRTHTGRYMPVVQRMTRDAETDAIAVKILGAPEFVTTTEHPFWVRKKSRIWDNTKRQHRRTWAEPEWVAAGDLTKDSFVGFQLDERDETVPPLGPELAYVVGRYLGDGWCRNSKRSSPVPKGQRGSRVNSRWWQMFICCDHPEADELQERIEAAGFTPARFEERTVTKFRVNNRELVSRLLEFGRYAHGKRIPAWVYRLPVEDQAAMWRGWVDSDGSTQNTGQVRVTTVSEQLAHGMARVARNVYRRAVSVHRFEVPTETVIEGRTVRQRAQYQVCLPTGNREAFVEGRWVWVPVRCVRPSGPVQVFNIGVQDDESYTAWGIAVHNCQDVSAAGRRAGMTEGTRSNLWVAMREAIATIRPEWVVWENVGGALSATAQSNMEQAGGCVGDAGNGPHLRALGRVLGDLTSLGYDTEWRTLRASDIGACHGRARVFVLAHARSAAFR